MVAYQKQTYRTRGNKSTKNNMEDIYPLDPENAAASSEGLDEPVHLRTIIDI